MSRFPFIGLILLVATVPARADVRIAPVMGDFIFTTAEVSCPSQPSGCYICVNDEDTTGDHRLMLAFGASSPFLVTTGYVAGVVRPFVEIDGVRLTPDLLPCGAYFRSGLFWFDRFTPPACDGSPPGVTYQIGSMPEVTVSGDGTTDIEFLATEAMEIPFEISLCSHFFYWGGGCDIAGSGDESWELFVAAPMNAVEVPAGDAPLATASESDFAIDFSNSAGGAVSVSHVLADPPVGPAIDPLNGYWDVHSDLAPGTFTAEVSFGYDAASLPPETDAGAITVVLYNEVLDSWEFLATTVDEVAQTATATTNRLHKFVLLGGMPVPAAKSSWGSLKARYGE